VKLTRVKSHDYHIIMERLLHVMFRGYLDDEVSKVLVELSNFYRQFSAKEITVEMMEKLEEIDTISSMQDGEIFPLGFFNPMQHLLIYLPYEAKVGGLV
jgi:hypothetical protein